MKFTTTAQASSRSGVKCLVYGRAGAGKTTLCGTAPVPLIISAEGGLLPLRHKNIPVIEVTSLQTVWDAYSWLTSNNSHAREIQTVCIDSASEIAEVVLVTEKKRSSDPRRSYGKLLDDMIGLLKAFRDLSGKHVVMTAKEVATQNAITGAMRYGPKAPGQQLSVEFPYLFDLVLHASVDRDAEGKLYHYVRTKPDQVTEAKDRSSVLDEIEYPDLTAIFNKIMKGM